MIARHAFESGMVDAGLDRPQTYRFGPYFVDVNRRTLLAGSQERPISEKVFQVLLLLLEAGGRVVEKRTFFERIWPFDASDANLAQHVFLLRGLLGETARDNSYILTVPGKGYRLATTIERKLGLTMKSACEACGAPLTPDDAAYICSYECTFCADCSARQGGICPNCGGEQTRRPRRSATG